MRQLLMLMLMVVMGAVGQSKKSVSDLSGLHWRDLTNSEKGSITLGVILGSTAEKILHNDGVESLHHAGTGDLIREMDAFYEVAANIPINEYEALVYTYKKLDGASKEELERTLTHYRQRAIK